MKEEKTGYFKSIDGLRLFASVSVVLYHYERMGGFNDLGGAPALFFRILKGPAFHASLFFMLAGFIFNIKYAPHVKQFSSKVFLKSRFRQLYPLHLITTLAMAPFMIFDNGLSISKMAFSLFMHLSLLWPVFPFYSYTMNQPSWALAAFFYCYLLFKPMLQFVNGIEKRRMVLLCLGVPVSVTILWSLLFAWVGYKNDLYVFFHVFPLMRIFEFMAGMLVSRLFIIRTDKERHPIFRSGWYNDAVIIGTLFLIYASIALRSGAEDIQLWFSYHFMLPVLFMILLYRFARGNGFLSMLMAFPIVRNLGKSSFYPYLLHIPLIAWISFFLNKYFGYNQFLHSPTNVIAFVSGMYLVSMLYTVYFRKRPVSKFKK